MKIMISTIVQIIFRTIWKIFDFFSKRWELIIFLLNIHGKKRVYQWKNFRNILFLSNAQKEKVSYKIYIILINRETLFSIKGKLKILVFLTFEYMAGNINWWKIEKKDSKKLEKLLVWNLIEFL